MFQTLKKLKNRISYEKWLKMVEQAYEKNKLKCEEYEKLLKDEND